MLSMLGYRRGSSRPSKVTFPMLINDHPRAKTRFWVSISNATIVDQEFPSNCRPFFASFPSMKRRVDRDSQQVRRSCRVRAPLTPCSHHHGTGDACVRCVRAMQRSVDVSSSRTNVPFNLYIRRFLLRYFWTRRVATIPTNSGAIFTTNLSFLTATKYS